MTDALRDPLTRSDDFVWFTFFGRCPRVYDAIAVRGVLTSARSMTPRRQNSGFSLSFTTNRSVLDKSSRVLYACACRRLRVGFVVFVSLCDGFSWFDCARAAQSWFEPVYAGWFILVYTGFYWLCSVLILYCVRPVRSLVSSEFRPVLRSGVNDHPTSSVQVPAIIPTTPPQLFNTAIVPAQE